MKRAPHKSNDGKHEMLHVVELNMRVVYTRATEWSLTMSDSTGEVRWRMCQLVSLAVTQIGYGNLPGISHLFK